MKAGALVRRVAALAAVLAVAGATALWTLSSPSPLPPAAVPTHQVDLRNGEVVYHAGSCLACHRPPEGSGRDAGLPSGGTPFPTPVGTFYPQNLTPDPETGIGRWSEVDFVNGMRLGLLIFDEATTALDPASEAMICETMRSLRGDHTILAISHQTALLSCDDHGYMIREGIAEPIDLAKGYGLISLARGAN